MRVKQLTDNLGTGGKTDTELGNFGIGIMGQYPANL